MKNIPIKIVVYTATGLWFHFVMISVCTYCAYNKILEKMGLDSL